MNATESLHPNDVSDRSTYRFWVNSMGEYGRGDHPLGGSVNIGEACTKAGVTQIHGKNSRLTRKAKAAVDDEFQRQARTRCTREEKQVLEKIWELQKLNGGRFRIYGGINHVGPWCILVTEFQSFTDNRVESDIAFWKSLDKFVLDTHGEIDVMNEDEHLDKHWSDSKPGHEFEPEEGREERVILGDDHGRPEKQVEVRWDIEGMKLESIKGLIAKLTAESEALWKYAGVGVC